MHDIPQAHDDLAELVDRVISNVGRDVVVASPIGVGKAQLFLNELYGRAKQWGDTPDKKGIRTLRIMTGLTLEPPRPESLLQERLFQALGLLEDYPYVPYYEDKRAGTMPSNVMVEELYFPPGTWLSDPEMLRWHVQANYTDVVRTIIDAGANVAACIVGCDEDFNWVNLGVNSEATRDLIHEMNVLRAHGKKVEIIGQHNENSPFMFGDAIVHPSQFTRILEGHDHELFYAPYKKAMEPADYMIGVYASALVKDGGTLQVGFGSIADAITWALEKRHTCPGFYSGILQCMAVDTRYERHIQELGGTAPFEKGIYGCSEFLPAGFMRLLDAGVIKREVFDDPDLEKLLDLNLLSREVTPETVTTLVSQGIMPAELDEHQVVRLINMGVLKEQVGYDNGELTLEGKRFPARLDDPEEISELLGERLHGHVVRAGFSLGPKGFYDELGDHPLNHLIRMDPISRVNSLMAYADNPLSGSSDLKYAQRMHLRAINSTMAVTLMGDAISDTWQGKPVSGVGGQADFHFMAQALGHAGYGGIPILALRAARYDKKGNFQSNIIIDGGNVTIPRSHRGIVITEYGIADLRGKTEEETAIALIAVADVRAQDNLLLEAKEKGLIRSSYRLPDTYRGNFPDAINIGLAPFNDDLKPFPYGYGMGDLDDTQTGLLKSLGWLKNTVGTAKLEAKLLHLGKALLMLRKGEPKAAQPYLEAMKLEGPQRGLEAIKSKALLVYALHNSGYLS